MNRITYYILSLLFCAALFVSCSKDDVEYVDMQEQNEAMQQDTRSFLALRITIGTERNTRAVPTGGEDGDHRENGQHHENDINNIVVFKVNGSVVTGADNLPVTKVAFVPDVDFHPGNATGNITTEINLSPYTDYTYSHGDHFIVAANMGNIAASTLGELRDKLVTDAWLTASSGVIGDFHGFVMSNESESRYTDGSGSPEDPRMIHVNIERVAARVDFCIDGSVVDGSSRKFDAKDKNQKVGNVLVSHARILNGMMKPTYLIKRLAENSSSSKFYLADEITPTTRYVCEPNTWNKPTATEDDFLQWFGNSRHSLAYNQQHAWFTDKDKVHTSASGNGFTTGTTLDPHSNLNYYVLGYVNENTMTPEATTGKTATAVALNAIYEPLTVYGSLDADGNPVEDDTYTRGQTFWRFRPITAEYDETTALYFSSRSAAEAYQTLHGEIVSEINEYTSARCYYIVYLRHDNSPVSPYVTPMEFGIVRNNIYRLKVSFTGPGYSSIPENTEVQPEGIKPYIYVKKWYYIEHPTIEL